MNTAPLPVLPMDLPDEYVKLVNELVTHAQRAGFHWLRTHKKAWLKLAEQLTNGATPDTYDSGPDRKAMALELTLALVEPVCDFIRLHSPDLTIDRAEAFARAAALGAATAEHLFATPTTKPN